ncbi:MAG TPA: cytochrome c3 family protein [Gemmatimonadales bacterium]|nr:cytochrome c3 family protein [Gemmatimonadales bacterium]
MSKLALVGAASLSLALSAAAIVKMPPSGAPAAAAPADTTPAWVLTRADSARLKGPRQPIFFRHDIHAGLNKIPCQYCHYSVAESREPGMPSVADCMGCHLVIGGADSSHKAEIKKLRDAWNAKQPIEWVRVHTLARFAHFPHMRHIKVMGFNACQTCHGDVARMPQVYMVNNIHNMGFCVTCHLDRKVTRDCSVCHY